jgi:hypothetical protein
MKPRKMKSLARAIALLAAGAGMTIAQDTGSITGTVTDSSGGAVPNAAVVLTSADRGIERATVSNSVGDFSVPGLPSASYDLAVTVNGFKKFQAKGIVLRIAQAAHVDVKLEVGDTTTTVTLDGESVAQVDTVTSEMAGTVTGRQISQLVLNGRNFTQLVTLVPGVSNQSGQDEGTVGIAGNVAMSINGGRTEYNNWELDGGDNMDNGSNATLNVYPNLDAIAEVKVLTSNYGAQYGRSGSGTVETITKSGTREFHGTVSEFVRNDAFNARNFFQDMGVVAEQIMFKALRRLTALRVAVEKDQHSASPDAGRTEHDRSKRHHLACPSCRDDHRVFMNRTRRQSCLGSRGMSISAPRTKRRPTTSMMTVTSRPGHAATATACSCRGKRSGTVAAHDCAVQSMTEGSHSWVRFS